MRVFHKNFILLLQMFGVVVAAILAGGCDDQDADKHRINLIVAVPASASAESPYESAVNAFRQAHPEIGVTILPISGSYYQKLLIMIAGGHGPDVMWMGQNFSEFADRGIFRDLSDGLAKDFDASGFQPQVLDWYRRGDKQFGIPFGIDVRFMAYNKRLFDEAGVAYPTNEWDEAQFMDAIRRLTVDRDGDGNPDQYGYLGEVDYTLFGAAIATADGSAAACNSPEMINFFETNLRMRRERIALPATSRADEMLTMFRQSRVAVVQCATWDLPFMRNQFADMDWDIVANPCFAVRAHWASSQAMVVRADTKYPDEAWLLCKAFLGEHFQRRASVNSIPANQNVAVAVAKDNSRKPENIGALLVAAETLTPTARVPRMMQILQIFNDACESVWSGEATPHAAVRHAESEINRTLAEARADAI